MPKIRRHNLPADLVDHLLDRIQSREISPEQLDHLQPLFNKLLAKQASRVLDWITVAP